jgi:hypothetical protein
VAAPSPHAFPLGVGVEIPAIIRIRNVNDRPGVEIFIHDSRISSGSTAGVYTFDGHKLRRAGGWFSYGGDSAQRYGFPATVAIPRRSCSTRFCWKRDR